MAELKGKNILITERIPYVPLGPEEFFAMPENAGVKDPGPGAIGGGAPADLPGAGGPPAGGMPPMGDGMPGGFPGAGGPPAGGMPPMGDGMPGGFPGAGGPPAGGMPPMGDGMPGGFPGAGGPPAAEEEPKENGGGGFSFGPDPDMKASVYIKDGKLCGEVLSTVYGGTVTDTEADDLRIVSYEGKTGGVFAEGASTDYTVTGAVISLSGDGSGLGEKSAGAGVSDHARLTVRDSVISASGLSRTCTSASGNSVLKVYDSTLISHGAPYGDDCPGEKPTTNPPAALGIEGNNRTHCTVEQSFSYFYNCTVTCDGWAALSTDASNGFVYLEANDCRVVSTKSGYGAYADWGCHDVFNNCSFNVASMGAIIGGEASVRFNECEVTAGTYLALMHCVFGRHTEVGELTVEDCYIKTGSHVAEVRGDNVLIRFSNSEIETDGYLVYTKANDDPMAPHVNGRPVFGVEVHIDDMTAKGDIVHEDPDRDMRVYFNSADYQGAIRNAAIFMDQGTRWYATGDSDVVLGGTVRSEQFDAPEGVTIRLAAESGQGTYALSSGGKLIVS